MKKHQKKVIFLFLITFVFISLIISYQSCFINNDTLASGPAFYSLPKSKELDAQYKSKAANICQDWYNRNLNNGQFNGGILIAKNGQILFEKYAGAAHVGWNDSMNAQTPLHIASVSKTFTAMAVLKLWQEGRLNLDDEFSKYFKDFNYPGVTIRTLLNHRSGLPNYVYFMDEMGWDSKKMATNQDVYTYLVTKKNQLNNIGKPNVGFSYCNTNYVLLALLIEKITHTDYPTYMKQTIFDPLGMKNSFVYTSADSLRATPSYDWRGYQASIMDVDKIYGDKNIFSTPQDMLKWDQLLSSNLYLSKKTIDESYKPYSNEKPGIRNYGLGWRMYNFSNGNKIIYHNGWWHGSNAVFIRLIRENATIIVIGNQFNKSIYKAKCLVGLFNPAYGNSKGEDDNEGNASQ